MLMHFLDAAKFGSLEEFQTEYEDLGEAKQARANPLSSFLSTDSIMQSNNS